MMAVPNKEPKSNFQVYITWLKSAGNVHLMTKMKFPFKIITLTAIIMFLLHIVSTISYFIMIWSDFEKRIDGTVYIVPFFSGTYRYIDIAIGKTVFEQFIRQVDKTIKNTLPVGKDYKKSTLGKVADKMDRVVILFVLLVTFIIISICLEPILSKSNSLPFKTTFYPFDLEEYYIHIFIFQIIVDTLMTSNDIAVLAIYLKSCALISEQFNVLEYRLLNLHSIEKGKLDEEIKRCVDFHNELIGCSRLYQKKFANFVFTEYVVVVWTFCFTAYVFNKVDIDFDVIPIVLNALATAFVGYGMIALAYNITERSLKISQIIYGSNWLDYDIKSQKALLIMMRVSDNTQCFKAGNILDMSIPVFLDMVKLSGSYFMVLKNLATDV